MPVAKPRVTHKHLLLDQAKIRRAKKLLGARTDTETVTRALDEVIAEHERNRLTREATERFLRSGIKIRDVYGKLSD